MQLMPVAPLIVEASTGFRYLIQEIISVAGMTFNCKLLTIEENCNKGNKVSLSFAKPKKNFTNINLIPGSK